MRFLLLLIPALLSAQTPASAPNQTAPAAQAPAPTTSQPTPSPKKATGDRKTTAAPAQTPSASGTQPTPTQKKAAPEHKADAAKTSVPTSAHKTSSPEHKTAGAPQRNFKESGNPNAPVTIDLYTDYQCPSCRVFYLDKLPTLIADFVATGKVHLIHRDFPLPMHQFGPLATRYANAAGEIGRYDLVAKQLFDTQPDWSQNGNVDVQVAKVLPPGEMQQVREIVKSDPWLEETVKQDTAQGNTDGLTETPFMVISGPHGSGKRERITGLYNMPWSVLKTYLQQKVGR